MVQTVALKELCEIDITDGTHKTPIYADQGYIFLSSKNVTSGSIDWDNVMYIPKELHEELYARLAPQRDDILLAKNGTTGIAAIVDRDEVFDIYVSLALIRPDKRKITPRYLLHAINSEPSKEFFNSHLKGIGVPNLHLTHIRETPIKVPTFEHQKKIIRVLDKMDNLISLRKQQLAKLDELVKARFVELFDGKGYPEIAIGELVASKVSSVKKVFAPTDTIKYIDISSIDNKRNVMTGYTEYVLEEAPSRAQQHIKKGDIVVSTVRPNLKNVAITGYEYDNLVASSGFCVLRAEKCLPVYLMAVVCSDNFTDAMTKVVTGANYPAIKDSDVRSYVVSNPPIELQEQFAAFVEQTDKSKSAIQQSLDKLETLKKALMQKYFG